MFLPLDFMIQMVSSQQTASCGEPTSSKLLRSVLVICTKSHQAKVCKETKLQLVKQKHYIYLLYIHHPLHYSILSCSVISVISDIEKIMKQIPKRIESKL